MFKFIWEHKIISLIVLLVLGVGGYYIYQTYYTTTSETRYVLAAAEKGTIITTVSGSGQVSASNQIDVKSKVSGDILALPIANGQSITAGAIIAQLDSTDAQKSVTDAEISLANAQISLQKLQITNNDTANAVRDAELNLQNAQLSLTKTKRGATDDELRSAQVKIDNAERTIDNAKRTIDNAKLDLVTTQTKADSDIQKIYDDALSNAGDSITKSKNTLITLTDIQYAHFLDSSQDGVAISNAKADAMKALFGAENAGMWNSESVSRQTTGLFDLIDQVKKNKTTESVNDVLSQVTIVLNKVKTTVNAFPFSPSLTSGEKNSLSSEKTNIESTINSFTSFITDINNQNTTNQTNISNAESKIKDAESNLLTAQNELITAQNDLVSLQDGPDELDVQAQELALKAKENALSDAKEKLSSNSTALDIQSQQLSIKQKQNDLANAQKKLADYTVKALFDGTIAKVNVKLGDSASANTSLATLITKQRIAEISLNEVDATKVKVGQKVTLTFDALSDLTITGQVVEIDTIGTVSQGVVSYTVKIGFDTQDERVKPGMSVSASIITDSKIDVLQVTNSAIKSDSNGASYVEVLEFDNTATASNLNLNDSNGVASTTSPVKKTITTGLSNDTLTEITSGIKEGDLVVTRTVVSSTSSSTSTSSGSSLFNFGPGSNRSSGSSTTRSSTSSSSSASKSNSSSSSSSGGDMGGPPPM